MTVNIKEPYLELFISVELPEVLPDGFPRSTDIVNTVTGYLDLVVGWGASSRGTGFGCRDMHWTTVRTVPLRKCRRIYAEIQRSGLKIREMRLVHVTHIAPDDLIWEPSHEVH